MVPHGVVLLSAALGPSLCVTLPAHEVPVNILEILAVLCLGAFISMLSGIGTFFSFIVFHGSGQSCPQCSHRIGDLLICQYLPLAI